MTKEIREQISAFVDNELNDAEAELLIRRLGADASLRAEAASLIRVSQRMRNERSAADDEFASRVFAAIHDEPTLAIAAPDAAAPQATSRGWLRMAAGGGIVAAVALIALNALPERTLAPGTPADPVGVVAETSANDTDASETFEYVTPAVLNDSGLVSANPELAAYFLSHTASGPSLAPGSGRARMLSGGTLADDESDEEGAAQ